MIFVHPRWQFTLADLVALAERHGLLLGNRRTRTGRMFLVLETKP